MIHLSIIHHCTFLIERIMKSTLRDNTNHAMQDERCGLSVLALFGIDKAG